MTYDEYLAHHGILGMRWGKRNGPPYPLNESQMTAKEKAKNEVSEFARSEAIKRAKFKEKVKMTRLKEREQVRQNKVQEREERRQNKVDERESRRQNRVDEKELSKQNEADARENWEQYKRGRTYVRKFLIGAGVMTVAGLAAYKAVKTRQENGQEFKKIAESVANAQKENGVGTASKVAPTAKAVSDSITISKADLGRDYVKKTLTKNDLAYMAPERLYEELLKYTKG